MTKLRASPDHFKAGLRASIVLLPIFGIQYTFYIAHIDPFETCQTGVFVARYMQIVVESLQGAIVTTIFCFLNGEVRTDTTRIDLNLIAIYLRTRGMNDSLLVANNYFSLIFH